MRFVALLLGLASLGFLTSCDSNREHAERYDRGYEAAWEGEEPSSSFWTSKAEKEGYEDGLDDAWSYDTGYDDGYVGRKPQYFNDPPYMDGYNDGKEDKKRGR